ncbi:MAG: CoA transferase [Pseudomonadota bacterium]
MKLSGLRVVDLSQFLPGPHLSMMMADHGADVIAVEPPGGEPVRNIGLRDRDQSVWFRNVSRGKRSISLDLKDDGARELLLSLVDKADVFIEAFRPGAAERLGLDAKTLRGRNRRLVYCSITAYGQTGPKKLKPAHDLSVQADSGAVFLNEGADHRPAMPAMPVADMAASLMALSGILMALLRRETTGDGDVLDIAMQDSLVAWYPNALGPVFAEDRSPVVKQERSWGGNAMYQIYSTADGHYLTLGGSELKFAHRLFTALNRDDLYEQCKTPPGDSQAEARQFLRATFAQRDLEHWTEFLDGLDICWAPVRALHEALSDTHLEERKMLLEDDQGGRHLGVPIKFQDEPGTPQLETSAQGQHGPAIARELGNDDAHIEAMLDRGAMVVATKS